VALKKRMSQSWRDLGRALKRGNKVDRGWKWVGMYTRNGKVVSDWRAGRKVC
jgi:hypothetical protein